MWLAKASSISAKFEILARKNYASFHGNWEIIVFNFKSMEDRFPDIDAKELQQNDNEWGAVDDNQQFPRL